MSTPFPPWVEGEKIPDGRVRDIFRPPPGAPPVFLRSHLIVGSRGVGKTTLLRFQKEVHRGVAIHLSLATEFAALTKQTGLGPLTYDIPKVLEASIIGKAVSSLALSIVTRLFRRGISVDLEPLFECIPSELLSNGKPAQDPFLLNLRKTVGAAPLQIFESLSDSQPLAAFVTSIGESIQNTHGSLLLLLDRADMVQATALVPVFQLLDQSSHYVALVAMRPGPAGQAVSSIGDTVVAGDHYGVLHLGISPRHPDWVQFLEAAVSAQIGPSYSSIPQDIRDRVIAASRDSLRTPLELFARYLSKQGRAAEQELVAAMEDLRENSLAAAQRTLQKHHSDFRKLVADVRNDAITSYGSISGPLILRIEPQQQNDLLENNELNHFIDAALRCGAFCMPEGLRWSPGMRPTDLEVPPILVWQRHDEPWTVEKNIPISLSRRSGSIFRTSTGMKRRQPSIFIAYRMRIKESRRFREELEDAIQRYPDLANYRITDGHVPAGIHWSNTIRRRISSAKIVVGDVTGVSPEVSFEFGFAFGERKVRVPAVSSTSDIAKLPSWLGAMQVGHFGDRTGINGIVTSIATLVSDPEFLKVAPAPQAIPGLAVWVRALSWNEHALQQFLATTAREGLTSEVFTDQDAEELLIKRAVSANLLVLSLDGTSADALAHFVCGAIAAKPKAGYGRTLVRTVLFLEEPTFRHGSLVADSVKKCQNSANIRTITLNSLKAEVETFGQNYNHWLTTAPKRRK